MISTAPSGTNQKNLSFYNTRRKDETIIFLVPVYVWASGLQFQCDYYAKEYSEFTSPTLLEIWMTDVSKAPGRMVSSPWPDRIEISTLTKESPDRYVITGFILEVTSTEIGNDGAAAKKPVRIVLQREQGHWLITDYAEEQ